MSYRSLYDVLGVLESASDEEVKAAYRQRMKVLHPDRGGSDDAAKQVNAAYEILSDAERRADYDRFANGAPCPSCGRLFKDSDLAVQHTIAHEMKRTAPARPTRAGVGRIVAGLGLTAIGLVTTAAAVSSDPGGVIWYGAIIAGGLIALRGLNLFVSSGHIRDAYDEVMNEVDRLLRAGTKPSQKPDATSQRGANSPDGPTESSVARTSHRQHQSSQPTSVAGAAAQGRSANRWVPRRANKLLVGFGLVGVAIAAIVFIGATGSSGTGIAFQTTPTTTEAPEVSTSVPNETTTTTPVRETTTTTVPQLAMQSELLTNPPYSGNVEEWLGLTYGSEYVDDWPYLVVGGVRTDLESFAAPNTLGINGEWSMAYFLDPEARRAYAILGAPDGRIGGALEYDYTDAESIRPPLCWDDAFGPIVFTHDPDTFEVLRAWLVVPTGSGNEFGSFPVPSSLTPDIDGYFVSGGGNIPSCSG